jgi:hypothetical protein
VLTVIFDPEKTMVPVDVARLLACTAFALRATVVV